MICTDPEYRQLYWPGPQNKDNREKSRQQTYLSFIYVSIYVSTYHLYIDELTSVIVRHYDFGVIILLQPNLTYYNVIREYQEQGNFSHC